MTERNDDMWDAGAARDAAIEARYRAASNEMPSAAADAAILAQARAAARLMADASAEYTPQAAAFSLREVPAVPAIPARGGAANDASWSRRLRAPLALAACAVLTVGIVTRIGVENPAGVTADAPVSASTGAPLSTPSGALPGERGERPAAAAPSAPAPAPAPSATAQAPAAPAPARAPESKPASAPADTASAAANQAAPSARAKASSIENTSDYAVASNSAPVRDAQPPLEAARKLREDERKQSAQVASAPPAQAERSVSAAVREPAVAAAKESAATPPAPSAPAPAPAPAPARALARSATPERGPDVAEMRKESAPRPAVAADATAALATAAPTSAAPGTAASSTETPSTAATSAGGGTGAGGAASGTMRKREAPAILSIAREAELTPERWLAYVIELRRAGLHAAADTSLARLRARYPEQSIPADARGPQAFPDRGK